MSVYDIATQEAANTRSPASEGPVAAAGAPPAPPAASTPSAPAAPGAPSAATANGPSPTVAPGAVALGGVGPGLGRALDSIGTYIPTEVMATYLAILAVIPALAGHRYQWLVFWLFLAATPIVVWVGASAAHPGQGLSLPVSAIRQWPWLSMFAATLAFAVFAISVPGSVVSYLSWYQAWMSTAAIILSAFVLSQANRIALALRPGGAKA